MRSQKEVYKSPLSLSNHRGNESGSDQSFGSIKDYSVGSQTQSFASPSQAPSSSCTHPFTPTPPSKGYPRLWQERTSRKEFHTERHRVSSRGKAVVAVPYKPHKKTMYELMGDLYGLQERKSQQQAKKIAYKKAAEKKIVEQIKQMVENKSSSSAFIEMYHNISLHMKDRKLRLYQKLWDLDLPQKLTKKNLHLLFSSNRNIQRRHSSGSIDRVMAGAEESIENEMFECPRELLVERLEKTLASEIEEIDPRTIWSQKYVLQAVEENPEGYAKFLRSVCQIYESMCGSCGLLENLCNKKLRLCHPEPNISGCNIHKSLFMSKILNCDLMKRAIRKAKKVANNVKLIDKCKELAQNICRLYQIEDDISNSRVRIKINHSDRIKQGLNESLSESEDEESSGEEYPASRGNSRPREDTDNNCAEDMEDPEIPCEKTPVWKKTVDEIMDIIEGEKPAKKGKKYENTKYENNGARTGKKKKNKKKKRDASKNTAVSLKEKLGVKDESEVKKPIKERLKPNIPPAAIQKVREMLKATMKRIDAIIGA